jgi:hypothetical protein
MRSRALLAIRDVLLDERAAVVPDPGDRVSQLKRIVHGCRLLARSHIRSRDATATPLRFWCGPRTGLSTTATVASRECLSLIEPDADRKKHAATPSTLSGPSPTLPWSELLKRCFACDVLQCERGGGRARVVSAIVEREVAAVIIACIERKRAAEQQPRGPPFAAASA